MFQCVWGGFKFYFLTASSFVSGFVARLENRLAVGFGAQNRLAVGFKLLFGVRLVPSFSKKPCDNLKLAIYFARTVTCGTRTQGSCHFQKLKATSLFPNHEIGEIQRKGIVSGHIVFFCKIYHFTTTKYLEKHSTWSILIYHDAQVCKVKAPPRSRSLHGIHSLQQ